MPKLNLKTSLWLFCCLVINNQVGAQVPLPVDFNRDIRPILSDVCFECHGPDANAREADLRLDLPDDLSEREIIVAQQPEASELIRRVFSDDHDEVMPPAEHRKQLTPTQKELLRRWVAEGAVWQGHWAWEPLFPRTSPKISQETNLANLPSSSATVKNYIDVQIQSKLAEAKLAPSPEADRVTLIRRLYFDLIGLPPTPEQVEAFVQDPAENAYEKVVDELLQSPHFGERLASVWLDQVRYADSVGYHGDQDVSVSPYRDYVIQSFNENKPFDQFTREQLAGDLLESPTLWQQVASGYNRLGMMSAEGGVQPEEYLTKYAADRVRTTASVWLGVTLGCAECHDHKFDPFSIDDFYSFAAFFADIQERGLYDGGKWGSQVEVADEELDGLLAPIDAQLTALRAFINPNAEGFDNERMAWETQLRSQMIPWQTLAPVSFSSAGNVNHQVTADQSVLISGTAADQDCYVVSVELNPGEYRGLRLEVLPHETLPQRGPGRAGNGNFVLTEFVALRQSQSLPIEQFNRPLEQWDKEVLDQRIPLANATATIEQAASAQSNPYGKWNAQSAIDSEVHGSSFGWAVLPETGKAQEWVVQFPQPLVIDQPETLTLVLQQFHGKGQHVIGHFRCSITGHENAVATPLKDLPANVREILTLDAAHRSPAQIEEIAAYYLTIAPRFADTRKQIADLEQQRTALITQHTRTSLVTVAVEPRPMRVLPRGNWMDRTGALVSPRFPDVFSTNAPANASDPNRRLNRLDLANWIVAPENPLTARVFVNRLWKLYFGTGLSKILDDLGSQGEWPSHPKLLDELARDFIESQYDIKRMIRLIVTSYTYRQSSLPRDDLATIDPYNRLLARQSRFRLDAELIRDNALAVSGLLIAEIGGRSVKPYQPAGLYQHLNFPTREYVADVGVSQFRRGVYTHWQRQFLHPAMKSFDAPSREECTCERPRSNTPIGALVLLNDPSYVEAARNLAARAWTVTRDGDEQSMLQNMFQLALSRSPSEQEAQVLQQLYQAHREHYRTTPAEADELTSIGLSPRSPDIPVQELAAWTSVARTIMNLHEFITRL